MNMTNFYSSSFYFPACFAVSAMLMWGGISYGSHLFLIGAILFFAVIDFGFRQSDPNYEGRDENFLIQQIVQTRSYLSYFLPIYGVTFGILLSDKQRFDFFEGLIKKSHLNLFMVLLPFILSILVMLFFPVRVMKNAQTKELTPAIKTLFVFNSFIEKTVLFTFLYVVLWMVKSVYPIR